MTVVYSKKKKLNKPVGERSRGRKKKKKTYELQNFYRHQASDCRPLLSLRPASSSSLRQRSSLQWSSADGGAGLVLGCGSSDP